MLSNSILILSTDSSVLNSIRRAARKLHIHVTNAEKIEEMLRFVERRKFMAIFIDYKTINSSFGPNIKKIQSSAPDSLIAMVAASQKINDVIHLFPSGAFEFIRKPVDTEEIDMVMRRLKWVRNLLRSSTQRMLDHDSLSKADKGTSTNDIETSPLEELIEIKLKRVIQKLNLDNLKGFYNLFIEQVEKPLLKLMLEKTRWNQIKTAKILGINRNTLRKKIREYNIKK